MAAAAMTREQLTIRSRDGLRHVNAAMQAAVKAAAAGPATRRSGAADIK
ncbi:MAG: hypothetical protein VB835_13395 [Pirellulales bacterium]